VALPDIFEYLDYRKYLIDTCAAIRAAQPSFSLRAFSRIAGSSSPNFYQLVVGGKIHPRPRHLTAIARSLGLTEAQQTYLMDLVTLSRAKRPSDREKRLKHVLSIGPRAANRVVRRDQYDYYATWYISAVRALIGFRKFPLVNTDYGDIGRSLQPPITAAQAQRAVEVLNRLGLIRAGADGCYAQSDAVVSTGDDVKSVQVCAFQRETMKLGIRALEECMPELRDISTLTLNISGNGYQQIRERVRAFRKEIVAIAATDTGDDRVYQLNMQLFPMSRTERRQP
jgi:uncharacterized protein (TIGR02147 family)